jgi:heme/copper-type cytochrome/quinol oxidase subunit 3
MRLGLAGIALANTLILVSSGVSITYTHRYILIGIITIVRDGFIITLIICNVCLLSRSSV